VTGLGILPLAVDRDDPGREIQGPMADSEETDAGHQDVAIQDGMGKSVSEAKKS